MEDNSLLQQQQQGATNQIDPLVDILRIKDISIEPNCCPLSAPLAITMPFNLTKPIKKAFWVLQYQADFAAKRHSIPLFTSSPPKDLEPGDHIFQQSIEGIPTQGVKEKYLLQMGMLKLELRSACSAPSASASAACGDSSSSGSNEEKKQEEEGALVSVNMVTQISKDGEGVLSRNVMSPLEE